MSSSPQWNTVLRRLANASRFMEAISVYPKLLRSGAAPNALTFPFALKSCAALSLPSTGQQLHCHVIKTGCLLEPFVLTSLITMYCRCFLVDNARGVFDGIPNWSKSTEVYNALISGHAWNSRLDGSVGLFREMSELGVVVTGVTLLGLVPVLGIPGNLGLGMGVHGFCVKYGFDREYSVGNSLLTMYVKCGEIRCARRVFDDIPRKGLISWNAMINGYAQNGLANDVLDLYKEMESSGVCPDPMTLVGVLSSCANLGAVRIGRKVEEKILSCGFGSNPFLSNGLVNMYARCGNLAKAREIFDGILAKSVVSWTAIINGYGMHGQGERAVEVFDEMVRSGIRPDATAFLCILTACSHAGMINKGLDYFNMMGREYGLQPGPEHSSCIVDLLGRAGQLHEALDHIKSMRVKPDGAVWGALLGACRIHRNVELAELAFKQVVRLEPTNIGYYVLLSNIYDEAGDTAGIQKVHCMMRERNLRKEPGCSYVEFRGRIHLFFAGDRNHPQSDKIYKKLDELESLVQGLDGYRRNDQETKKDEILSKTGVHSEKLAIVFGILNSKEGTEILVIKNLRICCDCHMFIKLVSKTVNWRFVVRDATRFHHFENGSCSCKEYW